MMFVGKLVKKMPLAAAGCLIFVGSSLLSYYAVLQGIEANGHRLPNLTFASTDTLGAADQSLEETAKTRVMAFLKGKAGGENLTYDGFASLLGDVNEWLFADPVGCVTYLLDSGRGALIDPEILKAAISQASHDNPNSELQMALRLPAGLLQEKAVAYAFSRLIGRSPEAALESLHSLPTLLQATNGSVLAREWTRKHGAPAVYALLKSPVGTEAMLTTAIETLCKRDPQAAWELLKRTPNSAFRSKTRAMLGKAGFVRMYLESVGPKSALESLAALPPSTFRDTMVYSNVVGFAALKPAPEELAKSLEMIPGYSGRSYALLNAAEAVATKDPSYAARLIDSVPGELGRTPAVLAITKSLAKKDLALAEEWVASIENLPSKTAALRELDEEKKRIALQKQTPRAK